MSAGLIMSPFRAFQILFALAFGASLPTLVALSYYFATGDPSLRPLGISSTALKQFLPLKEENQIEVMVATGSDVASPSASLRAEQLLSNALVPYDVPFVVRHFTAPGRNVSVSFRVGATVIGPYPIRQSAHGISAALAAFQLNKRATNDAAPSGRFLDP